MADLQVVARRHALLPPGVSSCRVQGQGCSPTERREWCSDPSNTQGTDASLYGKQVCVVLYADRFRSTLSLCYRCIFQNLIGYDIIISVCSCSEPLLACLTFTTYLSPSRNSSLSHLVKSRKSAVEHVVLVKWAFQRCSVTPQLR